MQHRELEGVAAADVLWQSGLSGSGLLPRDWRTGSLGRSDILRCGAVGVFEPIESSIAINAAERTDSDCAEKILLDSAAPMRPKYLGTIAIRTGPFGIELHF